MSSVRTRITASFGAALVGTIVIVAIAVASQRRATVESEVIERGHVLASLTARILASASSGDEQTNIYDFNATTKSFGPRLTSMLNALPEYVMVVDSGFPVYVSGPVARLSEKEKDELARGASGVSDSRVAFVPLYEDRVVVTDRIDVARQGNLKRQVVVAVSTRSVAASVNEVLVTMAITGSLAVVLSVMLAWFITGRIHDLDKMIADVSAITDGRSLHRRIPMDDDDDEIGRLGMTLNAMIERLEGSFAALRRFTADASHELKTPLTVLRADIERAMSAPARGTEQLVALEEALQETTRMADLVDSLLTLARADEGRFDLHREPVPLELLVRDVSETAHILGEIAGIHVSLTGIVPVTVQGDRVRLRQLFLNLVTNAIKYTARGGTVELLLESRDGAAVFTVKDTGIGIAGADLPFIFDRFWRVDRARSRGGERGGVGLGLAICQWIAQAHGGSIAVSSRMGRGSAFAVTIPVPTAVPGALPVTEA
jgi:two-component system OmpR family sensor kinase